MRRASALNVLLPVLLLGGLLSGLPRSKAAENVGLADRVCPLGAAKVETKGEFKGKRRLALVVGVGNYLAPNVPRLEGPPKDAEKVYDLLTDAGTGFGFPKENVCFLKNGAATRSAFKEAFQKTLVGRARDGDVVVLYFAGHGAQSPDGNGDETDHADETLMLADARYNGEIDLVDDELNSLLVELFRTMSGGAIHEQKVSVILDSCNSGSAARLMDSPLKPRFFDPAAEATDLKAGLSGSTEDLPGLVFVSAAIDGTAANEVGGEGLFTKGMIQTLRESFGKPLTWSQLVLGIRQRIPTYSAMVNQMVDVQGGPFVERQVFGGASVAIPPAYVVTEVKGDQITLTGAALPGWSPGATVRVYAWPPAPNRKTRTLADVHDPGRSKVSLLLQRVNGLSAVAQVLEGTGSEVAAVGDLAVLAIAGRDSTALKVRFATDLSENLRRGVMEAIQADPSRMQTIEVVDERDGGAAWLVAAPPGGSPQLFDPSGALRGVYADSADGAKIAMNLQQQARQRALMQIKGEAGADFVNEQTIQAWAEEAPPLRFDGVEAICPQQNTGYWDKAKNGPGTHALEIPLCHSWALHVKLDAKAPAKLYVGGLILSSDGGIIGFPGGTNAAEPGFLLLEPGQEYTFKMPLLGTPPVNVADHILVFGTREDSKVEWSRLTEAAAVRGVDESALQQSLQQFLNGGTRGVMTVKAAKPTTWTSSSLTVNVVANSLMTAPVDAAGKKTREFTVAHYDIREQLPANRSSALFKLLMQTFRLTNFFATAEGGPNGPRYNTDSGSRWDTLTDAENLAKGLDSSRAIWYAFTRGGLQYSVAEGPKNPRQPEFWARGHFINTTQMMDPGSLRLDQVALEAVPPPSPMRDQFQSCRNEAQFRQGDLLVYRRLKGQARADGNVVMVIDPVKNIVWGSHAWDGAAPEGSPKVDTGVEYQWIKSVKEGMTSKWDAWDSASMVLVDCWRHKGIAAEWAASPLNRSGSFDMSSPVP